MTQFTRCPECDTAFLVTDEHLALAAGKVRCGQCKSIFNANNYLLRDPELADSDEEELQSDEPDSEIEIDEEVEFDEVDEDFDEDDEDLDEYEEALDEDEEALDEDDEDLDEGDEDLDEDEEDFDDDDEDLDEDDEDLDEGDEDLDEDDEDLDEDDEDSDEDDEDLDEEDDDFDEYDEGLDEDEDDLDEYDEDLDEDDEDLDDDDSDEDDEDLDEDDSDEDDEDLDEDDEDSDEDDEDLDEDDEDSDEDDEDLDEDDDDSDEDDEDLDEDDEDLDEDDDDSDEDDEDLDEDDVDSDEDNEVEEEEPKTVPVLLVSDQVIEQEFSDDEQLTARLESELADNGSTVEETEIQPANEPQSSEQPEVVDEAVSMAVAVPETYHPTVEAGLNDEKESGSLFKRALGGLSLKESDPDKRAEDVGKFVDGEQKKAALLPKLLWLLGSTLILLLLVASIFWFKRFELASNHNWRPVVDSLCSVVDCGIPAQRDVKAIQLRSREVTLNDNDITVNMILVNTASFIQGYPRIEVDLFDLDGNLINTKIVLPAEYLRSDLRDSLMPVGIPVHIEYDININTEDIVGYVFRFL